MKSPFTVSQGSSVGASSYFRGMKPGDDIRRSWRDVAQVAHGLSRTNAAVQAVLDQVNGARKALGLVDQMHPFRLYNLPGILRVESDPEIDWRRFRVRAGKVIFDNANGVDATGTDGQDNDPYGWGFDNLPGTDIEVPEDEERWWFWLDFSFSEETGWGAVVRNYSDPAATAEANPSPWASFPVLDGRHIPLGYVDTKTRLDERTAIVRQYVFTDLMFGPIFEVCDNGATKHFSMPGVSKEAPAEPAP